MTRKQPARTSTDLKVFISTRDSRCDECDEQLGRKAWITLTDKGALCLACGDLEHLEFLPAGNAALTRRARKYSTLSAIVLKWSSARKQYERQGILTETEALDRAESECLADADARARRREREAERREQLDSDYVRLFAERVRELYPRCPDGVERKIAEHACLKYSGRVGRSASARALDPDAINLAVVAHVRHSETAYDALLSQGLGRHGARFEVEAKVDETLWAWRGTERK